MFGLVCLVVFSLLVCGVFLKLELCLLLLRWLGISEAGFLLELGRCLCFSGFRFFGIGCRFFFIIKGSGVFEKEVRIFYLKVFCEVSWLWVSGYILRFILGEVGF